MSTPASQAAALARPDYQLQDNLWAQGGSVFLTGTQALVRLPLMQRAARRARAGLNTRGFVSGYRGSPLGMVDQADLEGGPAFTEAGMRFLPAINEELAATAVLGTQRVESDPERTVEGVFAMWYGKGPGVDRAGDALKHGNAYGSSPHGGVLVVAGDDHGCVSSSMPHQSDLLFQACHMPIVAPANVAEYLEFGLYGWALSRYSGNWVGLTALSEVVESGATVDLDAIAAHVDAWRDADAVRAATGHRAPADGLHYRWPDLPSLRIEARLQRQARRRCARSHGSTAIDREVIASPQATRGHRHLRQGALRPDGGVAPPGDHAGDAGSGRCARLQGGLVVSGRAHAHRRLSRAACTRSSSSRRRRRSSSADCATCSTTRRPASDRSSSANAMRDGAAAGIGARRAATVAPDRARRATGSRATSPATARSATICSTCATSRRRSCCRNAGDAVKRLPYFCAGCPHNTSTRVPEGSRAQAGIGCHFMASVDGPRDRGPDPDGRRRRRLGQRTRCSPRCRTCSRTSATAPTTTRAIWRSARRWPPRPPSPTRSCSTTRWR